MVVDGWAEVCGVEPVLAAVVVCAKTNPLAREPTATEYANFLLIEFFIQIMRGILAVESRLCAKTIKHGVNRF